VGDDRPLEIGVLHARIGEPNKQQQYDSASYPPTGMTQRDRRARVEQVDFSLLVCRGIRSVVRQPPILTRRKEPHLSTGVAPARYSKMPGAALDSLIPHFEKIWS